MIKKILKYGIVFTILIFLFNFLLFISSLFPSTLIEENVKESSDVLSKEGNNYQISKYFLIVNNNYTDSIMINEAYSIDNTNPIYSYMTARKNFKKGLTQNQLKDVTEESLSINNPESYDPVGELEEFLNGNIDTSINYARYWHGYLPILRTLLLIFNIAEIRTLLLIIFVVLFIWLIKLIKDKIGITESIIFALSLIFQGYFFVSYSLESSPVFLTMMISSIILLKRIDKIKNLYLYIFIISCITNFVDYLTVPLITLGIPLLIYILYKQKNNKELNYKYYLVLIIKSSIVWFVGYAMTWLSKWIIYDLIYKEGLIKSAVYQVLYRSKISNREVSYSIWYMIAVLLYKNLEFLINLFYFYMIGTIFMIKKYSFTIKKASEFLNENIPIMLISLMPFVWYISLGNHSVMHYRFVYRHMLIFLIGILLCIKNVFIVTKKKIEKDEIKK